MIYLYQHRSPCFSVPFLTNHVCFHFIHTSFDILYYVLLFKLSISCFWGPHQLYPTMIFHISTFPPSSILLLYMFYESLFLYSRFLWQASIPYNTPFNTNSLSSCICYVFKNVYTHLVNVLPRYATSSLAEIFQHSFITYNCLFCFLCQRQLLWTLIH